MNRFFMTMVSVGLISLQGFAQTESQDSKLVKACAPVALDKLEQIAEAKNATLLQDTFQVEAVDNRLLNPFKYVWFSIQAELPGGEITGLKVLTQKAPFKPCF